MPFSQNQYLRVFFIFLFIGLFTACQQPFDATKWAVSIDGTYPHREKMVDDLLENHQLKGKTVQEITDLLGRPDNYYEENTNKMKYQIVVDYGHNIDPVYSQYLQLKLDTSSSSINSTTRIISYEIIAFDH